jgi:hypothetical protein
MTTLPRFILKNICTAQERVRQFLYRLVYGSGKYFFAAQTVLVIFCYGATAKPPALFFVLAAVLSALVFRDLYTHRSLGAPEKELPPNYEYCVLSAGDAVATLVFTLASQTLALKYSPNLALSNDALYYGAVVCLPLTAILRLVLRLKPNPGPSNGSARSARHIFIRTWVFNALWLGVFYGLVMQDVSDDPNSLIDPLRGGVPLVTFVGWILCQRNPLDRRNHFITIFTDLEKQRLSRQKETIFQGVKRGDPLYWTTRALEVLLFVELALSMCAGVWPWISGQQTHGGFLQIGARVLSFGVAVLSWKYVKRANIAAAEALQEAIDTPNVVYASL